MRVHTAFFSPSSMKTQFETSMTVRPQPRQISSNSVEHTATQGESAPSGIWMEFGTAFDAFIAPE